jgi:hypothetical protein
LAAHERSPRQGVGRNSRAALGTNSARTSTDFRGQSTAPASYLLAWCWSTPIYREQAEVVNDVAENRDYFCQVRYLGLRLGNYRHHLIGGDVSRAW